MAEESDLERTEQASPQKLEKAREEGDVPRSRELATFTVLMAAGAGLVMQGGDIVRQLKHALVSGLTLTREQVFQPDVLLTRVGADLVQVLLACLPVAGVVMLVALASPMLIGGWMMNAKSLGPNFGRMNPLKGLANMVSMHALVELGKAVGKTLVVGIVAWIVVMTQQDSVIGLVMEPLRPGLAHLGDMLGSTFLYIVAALGLIAAIDAPYQMWHYADKLKMTKQEVTQESKESDGNPQIKGRIRYLQREMAKKRMMTAVPTADVVVTNPTHYAVALKYSDGSMGAPLVVAKGADEVAAKIREIAKENKVTILEAPVLARALYTHTEIGDEIPEALYKAVAEVLAYVFNLRNYSKHGGMRPDKPTRLEVPPQLDPHDPAAKPKEGRGRRR